MILIALLLLLGQSVQGISHPLDVCKLNTHTDWFGHTDVESCRFRDRSIGVHRGNGQNVPESVGHGVLEIDV